MKPNLVPVEPLSEVAFVHDYVQLRFQDEIFSLFNGIRLTSGSSCIQQGEPGFADGMVGLIGQRILAVPQGPEMLTLRFGDGSILEVLKADASGPEAFMFHGPNNLILVEQNV
jgi:hypothetical protein